MAVVGFAIVFMLMPVLAMVAIAVGAWREGRRSPWPFSIGTVISNSFAGIGGAPLAFLLASFALNALPQQGIALLMGTGTIDAFRLASWSGGTLAGWGLLWIFLWPFAQMLMMTLALDTLQGRPVDVRGALARALRRTPAAIVVTILFAIGVFVGLGLLVVPGIFAMLTWFVALPVLAAEGGGILNSFERSGQLLRGMRWRLLLLLLLAAIAWLVAGALAAGLAVATAGAGPWAPGIAQVVAATLLGTIPPAGTAAIYHEARTAKGDVDSRDLEAVFA